jgi:hypothetical protein
MPDIISNGTPTTGTAMSRRLPPNVNDCVRQARMQGRAVRTIVAGRTVYEYV